MKNENSIFVIETGLGSLLQGELYSLENVFFALAFLGILPLGLLLPLFISQLAQFYVNFFARKK